MIDIVGITQGEDFRIFDSDVPRAANILGVQLASLEYKQDFGIDLEYFLDPDFSYQNESFKNYLVQVLSSYGINVSSVIEVIENLYSDLTISIEPTSNTTSLISR